MLKDLNGRIVPHPTEYLVMVGDRISPITKRIAYTRVAQFVHKSHAEEFAKSITSFHTAVIEPEHKSFDNSPIWINGQCITLKPEGWGA